LVALALTGIVSAAIYKAFSSQQKVYIVQDEVVEMQQNLRAAMDILVREIRMAGYDPTSSGQFLLVNLPSTGSPNYGRQTGAHGIAFFTDIGQQDGANTGKGNGSVDNFDAEQVAFRVNVKQDGGALDGSAGEPFDYTLRRYSCGAVHWQPLVENIEAIGFSYGVDADGDGMLDHDAGGIVWAIDSSSPPDGTLDTNLDTNHDSEVNDQDSAAGVALVTPVGLETVRAVKIWLLARSHHQDKDFHDTKTYVVANQRLTMNDGYRRRLLTTTVSCRNLGLVK
jgi:type IV pilus assembly protein PilW